MINKAKWSNGKKILAGSWEYYRPSDIFIIRLNSKDVATGLQRVIMTHRDVPEWGNWKRVEGRGV